MRAPSLRRIALFVLSMAFAMTLAQPRARAGGDDEVVVSAGGESSTVADVTRRLAQLPPFQRRALGSTPDEARKAFVDHTLIPELLYTAEAKRRGLDRDPQIETRIRQMLARSVEEQIRDSARVPGPSDADVKAYYDAHSKQYNSPARIRIWRIVVADEAAAKQILDQVKGQGQVAVTRWSQLARERSLDKATAMRDGDLGLVYPDGSTELGRVQADAKLYVAADGVKDGEFVAAPVKIDSNWAVVWRRGSLPPVRRTLADERVAISRQLERETADKARRDLIAKLRAEQVKDLNPDLLKNVQISSFGTVGTPSHPGGLPGGRPMRPAPPNAVPPTARPPSSSP